MPVDDFQAIKDAVALWERIMGGVLIALSLADVVAFTIEWCEHRRWTRAAKAEAFALLLFVVLGLGDWHVVSLQEAREQIAEQRARSEAQQVGANVDALKSDLARRDQELAPFIKLAQAKYPAVDPHTGLGRLAADVDGLRAEVKEAQAQVDEANRALAKTAQRLAPRHLTTDQRGQLTELARAQGIQGVNLFRYGGDPEILAIDDEIFSALTGARWRVTPMDGTEARVVTGIMVEIRPGADAISQKAVITLTAALRSYGLLVAGPFWLDINAGTGGMSNGTPDPSAAIRITVGKKQSS
jgi:hypothetical protein